MRKLVTFRSDAFNSSEERDYFINPGNFGDDLARWLIGALAQRGIRAGPEPGQEDHGWYFSYWVSEEPYTFVVAHRDGDSTGDWVGWVERDVGFLASILGRREKGIKEQALRTLHETLVYAASISDVRWHESAEFRSGNEEGSPEP